MPAVPVSLPVPHFTSSSPSGSLSEKALRRAGLDYWRHVDLRLWPSWQALEDKLPTLGEPFFFSTKGARPYWEVQFPRDVVLIFGRETGGLPPELHARYAGRMLRMPIVSPHVRSLNLSTSAGIALYEVMRQHSSLS